MIKLGWTAFSNSELSHFVFLQLISQFYQTNKAGVILFELKKGQGIDQLQEIEKNKQVIVSEQFFNQSGRFLLFDRESTKRINSLAQEHITPLIKKILKLANFKDVLISLQQPRKLQKCLLWELNCTVCLIESCDFSEQLVQVIEWYNSLKKHCQNLLVITAIGQRKPVIEPSFGEYKAVFGTDLSNFHLDQSAINKVNLFQKILEQAKIKATSK